MSGHVAPNLPEAEAIHAELGRGQAIAGAILLNHFHSALPQQLAPTGCTNQDYDNCNTTAQQDSSEASSIPVLTRAEAVRQRLTGVSSSERHFEGGADVAAYHIFGSCDGSAMSVHFYCQYIYQVYMYPASEEGRSPHQAPVVVSQTS